MTTQDPYAALPEVVRTRRNVAEYRKTVTVMAGQTPTGGIIPTLEGDHTYEAGDYICGPGQAGEYWPVKRSIFEATYALVATPPAIDPTDPLREAAQAILDRALDFFDDDDLDPESSLAMPVVLKARDVVALRAALGAMP